MPRKVQDIIPAERRTIREVKPAPRVQKTTRTKKRVTEVDGVEDVPIRIDNRIDDNEKEKVIESIRLSKAEMPERRMPITPPIGEFEQKRRNIWKWPIITLVAVLAVGLVGYFGSTYYSQATFTVTPKVIPVSVNSTYVAQPTGNDLVYQVVSIKRSATTTVSASNGPVTNTKATGKVTFYNTYSSQSIRLIAGTRLSGTNGLMYRLSSSIVIPGYTKPSGTIIPGKISANISADQAGQQFNIADIDQNGEFKIVAYSGSPKYSAVYAKAVTAIAGGFSGVKKVISPQTMASTTAKLKSDLTNTLMKEVESKIPEGYIVYDKNFTTSFSSPIIGGGDTKTASVSIDGTINAIAMPKSKLIETFAGSQTVALFSPFMYTSPGLENIDVTITNIKDFSPTKKGALVLKAKGEFKIVGSIPIEDLKSKLAGVSLSKSEEIFKSYSAVIESGSGELAPPWANIPTDLNKIKVVVEEP